MGKLSIANLNDRPKMAGVSHRVYGFVSAATRPWVGAESE